MTRDTSSSAITGEIGNESSVAWIRSVTGRERPCHSA